MHLVEIDDIRSNTTTALKVITQKQFQNSFEGWTRRWYQCVLSQEGYLEGDQGGFQQLVV
jgi:hypothetical protein